MIIDFQDVTYMIPNGDIIYKNLNLKVFNNDFYGVLGKNGAGKSTLIEMIMGLRKLTQGTIKVFGEDCSSSSRQNKHKIFVATNDIQIPGSIEVSALLKFYEELYPTYDRNIEAELLKLFEIESHKKIGALSTGQKVKVMLIAGFAAKVQLYLFDEVTAVLDPKSRRNFFIFLNRFKNEHTCSVFLATNIAEDLENCMDKVIFLDDNHQVLIKDVADIDELFEDKKEAS